MPPIPSLRRSRGYIFAEPVFFLPQVLHPRGGGKKMAAGGWSVGSKLAMCFVELVHMFHLVFTLFSRALTSWRGVNLLFTILRVETVTKLTPACLGSPRLFGEALYLCSGLSRVDQAFGGKPNGDSFAFQVLWLQGDACVQAPLK